MLPAYLLELLDCPLQAPRSFYRAPVRFLQCCNSQGRGKVPSEKKSMHTFSFLNPSCLTSESVTIQLVKLYLCRGDLRVILWTRRCAKVSGQYLDVEVGDLGGNHIVSRYGGKSKMEEKTTISLVSYL